MDSDTASRFVSSLVKSIQALCNGYIDFSTSIEVVGHIHLRIDHNHKFNYVLSEEVSKSVNEGSTIFSSHSYHSLPPPSAPPTKLAPTSTGGPSSRRKSSHPLPRQEETDPMPVSLPPEVPSRSKELVSDRLSESGDSSHSLSMVVFPEIDELTGSGKPHSNTSGGRTRTISHTQDTLDRRRKSETHAPRSVDSPAKRSRDEESGSVQKTEFEVIEIKEEPGLDEPSCAFSESNQLPSHQAGMGHTPDFSNCVMESLDRVGQIEGTSLLSASDGQQLHLASHQGQSDQPFPVMLHANPSVQAPGGVLTLPGPSNSQATASTTPGEFLGHEVVAACATNISEIGLQHVGLRTCAADKNYSIFSVGQCRPFHRQGPKSAYWRNMSEEKRSLEREKSRMRMRLSRARRKERERQLILREWPETQRY
ncbi:uncharacterized protein LOC112564035 isoform X24 [Pomacea canaliculata]|uniref:uncharacterized protein LOC112564035 isoform X24 n=1 Tax=Pomacea canaliculata TaxID=400727 RepID=UPI000D73EFB8|nr:uncharacterized protein LOC112564035 isoform X24 [Pomacea canaliculata]